MKPTSSLLRPLALCLAALLAAGALPAAELVSDPLANNDAQHWKLNADTLKKDPNATITFAPADAETPAPSMLITYNHEDTAEPIQVLGLVTNTITDNIAPSHPDAVTISFRAKSNQTDRYLVIWLVDSANQSVVLNQGTKLGQDWEDISFSLDKETFPGVYKGRELLWPLKMISIQVGRTPNASVSELPEKVWFQNFKITE